MIPYILGFIPGYKKDNKNNIFLKVYKYNNDKIEILSENNIPDKFHGVITLKLKALCKDNYNNEINYKLLNDIITIINKFMKLLHINFYSFFVFSHI